MSETIVRTYLELDPHHPATHGLLTDAHRGHQLTMAPFGYSLEEWDFFTGKRTNHGDHRAHYNILWAANLTNPAHSSLAGFAPKQRVRLIIQSDIEPRFDTRYFDQFRDALVFEPTVKTHTVGKEAGEMIKYQIIANPVRNHRDRETGKSRTVVASRHDEIVDWWVRKAASAGLSLTGEPIIDKTGASTSRKRENLLIRHARLTGKAMITDPEKYAAAAHKGIGKGRAYGCGLLLTM